MSAVYLACFLDSCMPIAISATLTDIPCCRNVSSQFRPPFLCEASDNPFFVHSIFIGIFLSIARLMRSIRSFQIDRTNLCSSLANIITPIDLNVNRGFRCCRRIPTANSSFLKFCRVAQIASPDFVDLTWFLHHFRDKHICINFSPLFG